MKSLFNQSGVSSALIAAFLFGMSTPLSKLLLVNVSPWLLAGLLYLGSGIGLLLYRLAIKALPVKLTIKELLWFTGAVVAGGLVAPVLLMWGLLDMPASGASLLLNTEGVFTALLAWFVFKENFDRRIGIGMLAIVVGATILSWPDQLSFKGSLPALAILGACFAWGIDNNLTRKVSLSDATWIASMKGLVAGTVNLMLAFSLGATFPSFIPLISSLILGFIAYGMSLTLFVISLRHLGTARTGAYFSIAPFFGALMAIAFGEPITLSLIIAGLFMATGIWLHLTEYHEHIHSHMPIKHDHEHTHEGHHQHSHEGQIGPSVKHTHAHQHLQIMHSHPHYPDSHHQHDH
jgi:drug/metabolite transporter (DMT)-like permease